MAGGLSLYVERRSLLHRLHPLTKGVLALGAIALAFTVPSIPWIVGLEIILLVLSALAGVFVRLVKLGAALVLPLAALLVIVQGLVNPIGHTLFVSLGPIPVYREGLVVGAEAILRITCLVTAIFLVSFTTKPSDLTEALIQRGLSPRIGYVLESALQIIPEMLAQAGRIQDAQRARGLETQGSLLTRARAYLPLLLPLVLASLVATQERAMALEVRGFGLPTRRVERYQFRDRLGERVARWLIVVAFPVALVLRWRGWT